ncbi:tRNA splicing endonuclease subunit [Hirsutella rhossiliensis]
MSDHQDGPGGPSPPPLVQETVTHMSSRHINGRKNSPSDDVEADSELSEPDSNLHSPPATGLEDEIVVGAKADRPHKTSPLRVVSMDQDHVMEDVRDESSTGSHYPKRKRTSLYNDLSETKMEISQAQPVIDTRSPPLSRDGKSKPNRQSLTGVKGVLLGHWRDSTVPDESRKHAVIGFIDVRDRLRTRVQPQTKEGESLTETYPLPPGPGGSWVTFERVVFSDHLVGLDHFHIKEYTRLRSVVAPEETEEERKVAEVEAVREAVRRVKENPATDNPTAAPAIAYGTDIPEHLATPNRPDGKRRKVSGSFAPSASTPSETPAPESLRSQTPPQPMAAHQTRFSIDPLPGTRPTRILIGYWKPSSEAHPRDRHAVYGILGQNDMFRVKVVRETRDGRFVDGNFPSGAGALWISYEEVEFEDHLKSLNRQEVKEYCRIRQYQLDHGETDADRIDNETKAVYEAQTRAGSLFKQPNNVTVPTFSAAPTPDAGVDRPASRLGHGGHELRQSRRIEPRPDGRTLRQALTESELRSAQRMQGVEAAERTSALARREIARAEAAQGRADRKALTRERAVAAATDAVTAAAAAAAAAAAPVPSTNGRALFHESEEMQRLNKVWARQESLRLKGGAEDAKMYDGVKYERKPTGPFMGKLVSQGTIINIDGEDYVEYRVLTKPSFF